MKEKKEEVDGESKKRKRERKKERKKEKERGMLCHISPNL